MSIVWSTPVITNEDKISIAILLSGVYEVALALLNLMTTWPTLFNVLL